MVIASVYRETACFRRRRYLEIPDEGRFQNLIEITLSNAETLVRLVQYDDTVLLVEFQIGCRLLTLECYTMETAHLSNDTPTQSNCLKLS